MAYARVNSRRGAASHGGSCQEGYSGGVYAGRVGLLERPGCPQVDNGLGKRTLLTIGKDMRHDIMANFLFLGLGDLEVYVVRVCFHLGDHFGAHCREAHFVLGLGQGYPALAPVGEFVAFGKKALHFPAGVAGNQRFLINVPVAFHVILDVA